MEIVQSYLTKNPCYTEGKTITVKGLMLHSVGCNQPSASVFINNWNSASHDNSCVHAFIDGNSGVVYQTLPWNRRGWHCGGTGNDTHIGVEMCEPACITYTSGSNFTVSDKSTAQACVKRTYNSAVELFAYLCKQYSLDPTKDGVIVSHKEGHSRGIASNHADPEHLWSGVGLSYTMDQFRKDVKAAMSGSSSSSSGSTVTSFPSCPFSVKVLVDDLNIRDSASMSGKIVGQTGKGTFTITKVSDGWGYLKSGAGWILIENPDYVTVQGSTTSSSSSGSTTTSSYPDCPFTVKVLVSDLNIRSEASMNGKIVGQTGKGTFTITKVSDGWGYLKSGAGWILIENPEYVTIEGSTTNSSTSSYKVKVTTSALNIRSGPGTSYSIVGSIKDKGTYTIVETSSNWGKLKSGAGWICLDYTEKV